jgi:hypothetical protein
MIHQKSTVCRRLNIFTLISCRVVDRPTMARSMRRTAAPRCNASWRAQGRSLRRCALTHVVFQETTAHTHVCPCAHTNVCPAHTHVCPCAHTNVCPCAHTHVCQSAFTSTSRPSGTLPHMDARPGNARSGPTLNI